MLNVLPDIIFYPLIIIWSVLYGSLAGAFYKLVAVYENWLAISRLEIILWKKYPQRSYRRYISSIWASQIRGKPVEMAEYTRMQVEQDHPREPFPFMRLFINTLFMILIAPYMALRGLIDGPVYVYKQAAASRQR